MTGRRSTATQELQTLNQIFEWSTTMNLMSEELARAHMRSRLEQAQKERLGYNLAAARRLSRKAERAAAQARLALARVI
ncbi:hypothetical protein ABIE44_002483 [Marmoricola sp. OAE513]|uniref:hypothetical protein n=1 Tax=Marmoricola sp. OAE513 TaxID=2817894 RepID=UPI003395C917